MNKNNFCPTLFIGIGEGSFYYTLRETYLHEQWVGGQGGYMNREVRSFHHRNLSQNLDEAITKAEELSTIFGTPLRVKKEELEMEMGEIKRATAEQMAERARRIKEAEIEYQQIKEEKFRLQMNTVAEGKYPFGQYLGKPFADAPASYINWFMKGEFEEGTVINEVKLALWRNHPDLALPEPDKEKLAGTVGKRATFNVTLIKEASFMRNTYAGYGYETVYVTTMVTDAGECLVCFSTSFGGTVGEKIKIKATVKEHSDYKGQAQTIVQRVKILEEK